MLTLNSIETSLAIEGIVRMKSDLPIYKLAALNSEIV
jgi:hypothetical protein